jgi:hypothetical protein
MAPPRSLAFQVYDDLIVVALGQSAVRDDDFFRFIDEAGSKITRSPRPILVVSEGGLLSASQRAAMDHKLPSGCRLETVIADSFRAVPKPDHYDALLAAFRSLAVAPSRDAAIVRDLPRLLNLVAGRPSLPSNYSDEIFDAMADNGRLWGRFWVTHRRERLLILAPLKGDDSPDDLAMFFELCVVQTTAALAIDLVFWQPNQGYRGSTKTSEQRRSWTTPDPTQASSLELSIAGRAWGCLVVETDRWKVIDPKGRTRLELTATTAPTERFGLHRGDAPVLRVAALALDGKALQSTTLVPP